jgi:Immunity protein 22
MLGQPDPIVPVRCKGAFTKGSPGELERTGFVSLWVGTFASIEEAEAYFGIPDEIGVYLPADAFARDFSLGNFPPENLEVNFEQLTPRPLRELIQDATFADSFVDQAVQAAAEQGIRQAPGIVLLYDFDYRRKTVQCDAAGSLRFVGAFPYATGRMLPFQGADRQDPSKARFGRTSS